MSLLSNWMSMGLLEPAPMDDPSDAPPSICECRLFCFMKRCISSLGSGARLADFCRPEIHSCASACFAVGRALSSSSSRLRIRSFASADTWPQCESGNCTSAYLGARGARGARGASAKKS
jgi:hypothetical protein